MRFRARARDADAAGLILLLGVAAQSSPNCTQWNGKCKQCTQRSSCGYCTDTQTCVALSGKGNCSVWNTGDCTLQCATHTSCSDACLQDSGNCAWCAGTGPNNSSSLCVPATTDRTAPLDQTCALWFPDQVRIASSLRAHCALMPLTHCALCAV